MIIENAYYKLTEHELKDLLDYKSKWLKEFGYNIPNPSDDWKYIDNYTVENEIKNYKYLKKRI